MLNKISNINSGLELNKSVKFRKYKKNGSGSFQSHIDINDSINISPALAFFDDSNWILKNLNRSSDNKIYLDFTVHEFDFKMVIDAKNLNNISYLKYSVHKINEISVSNKLIQADILVEPKQIPDINHYDSFNMLEVLFSRIARLNIATELTRNDTRNMDELLDNIFTGLYQEFESISGVVLNFLKKYTDTKIELKNTGENLIQNNITVDRIKIINV